MNKESIFYKSLGRVLTKMYDHMLFMDTVNNDHYYYCFPGQPGSLLDRDEQPMISHERFQDIKILKILYLNGIIKSLKYYGLNQQFIPNEKEFNKLYEAFYKNKLKIKFEDKNVILSYGGNEKSHQITKKEKIGKGNFEYDGVNIFYKNILISAGDFLKEILIELISHPMHKIRLKDLHQKVNSDKRSNWKEVEYKTFKKYPSMLNTEINKNINDELAIDKSTISGKKEKKDFVYVKSGICYLDISL